MSYLFVQNRRPIPYDELKKLGIPPPPEGRYMTRYQVAYHIFLFLTLINGKGAHCCYEVPPMFHIVKAVLVLS